MREARGCESDTPTPIRQEVPGYGPLHRCPVRLVTPEIEAAMEAWDWRRTGFLPAAGGWADQANSLTEALMEMDAAVRGVVEREREKWRREMEKNK